MAQKNHITNLTELLLQCVAQPDLMLSMLEWLCSQLMVAEVSQQLGPEESLELLATKPKSFVRLGDGECKIIMGMDQPFQKYDKELADRLIDILKKTREDLYVGINKHYFVPVSQESYTEALFYRRYAHEYRKVYYKYASRRARYIDSEVTLYNIGTSRSIEQDMFFEKWKSMFRGKDIVIVCGEKILDKLNYDIFELAKSKKFIYGPKKNAWEKYHQLIDKIVNETSKDKILVFILGMAGKAMIPELTDRGYICWDVGHLAKHFDAYMSGMEGTENNIRKFFSPD